MISVEKVSGGGRYDRIVKMIEASEKLKSTAEDHAARLADKLVPYTLGGTALTFLLTRNVTKTLAVLMVDFFLRSEAVHAHCRAFCHAGVQCRPCAGKGRTVPGGRGQCGHHRFRQDRHPDLRLPQGGAGSALRRQGEESEMLRLAACLEEHYPHSLANAVVEEAKNKGLNHEEYHSQVEDTWWPTAFPAW